VPEQQLPIGGPSGRTEGVEEATQDASHGHPPGKVSFRGMGGRPDRGCHHGDGAIPAPDPARCSPA
jgi:hypothetical protein